MTTENDIIKTVSKQEIREIQKSKRNQYTNEMRKSLNKRVYKLMDYLFKYIENVDEFKHRSPNNRIIIFIYLSSYEKVEVDTWNIISDLLKKDNYMVYVPKIVGNSIIPVKYSNSFTINRYGIFECNSIRGEDDNIEIIPDIIITPLLAFSINGDRIGYGGGYYDRYLANVKQNKKHCVTVGLSFENHTTSKWNIQKHDIKLDYVVSSMKIYEF